MRLALERWPTLPPRAARFHVVDADGKTVAHVSLDEFASALRQASECRPYGVELRDMMLELVPHVPDRDT